MTKGKSQHRALKKSTMRSHIKRKLQQQKYDRTRYGGSDGGRGS
jgi:hypothetical protein